MNDVKIPFPFTFGRLWMTAWMLLVDFMAILAAGLLAIALRRWLDPEIVIAPAIYLRISPLLLIFLFLNNLQMLYPTVGISPVEELRRLTYTTSIGILLVAGFAFWAGYAEQYSRLIFGFIWVFAICLIPFGRWLVRAILVHWRVWGEAVVVVGNGKETYKMANFLLRRMRFGLRPFLVICASQQEEALQEPIPVYQLDALDRDIGRQIVKDFSTAILVTTQLDNEAPPPPLDRYLLKFRRLILISDQSWIGSLGVIPHDLEGTLGLEISQNLRNAPPRYLKRLMDIGIGLAAGLFLLPWLGLIALIIRLDSPGPALYRQVRIGRFGKKFTISKFRTMYLDAEQTLQEYLSLHPEAHQEWEVNQKLKDDPRVTRAGRFLRRFSLDELPQIWNVLIGEMSLVGPRPIIPEQIDLHTNTYRLYKMVRPGLTGMWQVSGRADLSFQERTRLDEYYVRNWSIWLDIYILARTLWAVLRQQGAY